MLGRVFASTLLLLLVSGCQIPILRGADPGLGVPADFTGRSSPDSSAQLGIGEFFDDPVLTQLLTEGLAQNQELKIRNEEIQIAYNEITARRGAYLPFVSLGARGGFDRTSRFTPLGAAEDQLTPPRGRFSDPLPNTRLSANLFWQVDIWRELRNARDAATERYYETIEERNFLITRLVADTAENYYELAALDKRLEFLNQTIEIQNKSLELAKAQKAAARGTELPVQRFLAEVRKNESQIQIVQQDIVEAENRINFLVGRFPQAVDRKSWDVITLDSRVLMVGVPAQLLQNRRDIRAAEHEVSAAGLDVQVARARFFPRLDISAGIGFEAFNPRYLFDPGSLIANAAGDLVAPLINKKAIQADYSSANARQLQAIYNYQRTVLNAFTEVVTQISKVEKYRRSVELKREQVVALEESVTVATDLFIGVRGEYVDVLFSQRDLLEARTALIEAKQQQLSAIVKTYQALGGGYLLSSDGVGFDQLFCPPSLIAPQDMLYTPTPAYTGSGPTDNAAQPVQVDVPALPAPSEENLPVLPSTQ